MHSECHADVKRLWKGTTELINIKEVVKTFQY